MIEIPKKEPLNIVPFIDIMLVLLAMVLSISTFIAKGEIKIDLPKSQTGVTTANSEPKLIQIDSMGDTYVDGKKVTNQELDDFIRDTPRDERIVLRIDKNTKFDYFIQVVDSFKKYQHENFSIVTEKAQ